MLCCLSVFSSSSLQARESTEITQSKRKYAYSHTAGPALLFIILLVGTINYLVRPKTVSRYVGKGSGVKGWLLAICTGILSHGPIYAWYALLRNLRDQGMKSSLIAVFLYNKAIKIPLLPLIIYYFAIPFVAILTGYMIIASIVQGQIVQMSETRISH